jgi:uncharacterized membrane protein
MAGPIARSAQRDPSLDFARGVILALMALDHTRMFFTAATFDPVSAVDTTPGYFWTRWITHLCAPGFFFLAGLSISLMRRTGRSPPAVTAWLATRGAWLVLLEFTVVAFAWSFVPGWLWFGVIWSLGAAMLCMSFLHRMPGAVLGAVAGAFLLAHDTLPQDWLASQPGALALLFQPGFVETAVGPRLVLFPLVPWLAVMILGYALGNWLVPADRADPARFASLGLAGIAAFAILRAIGFGQPQGGGYIPAMDPARDWIAFFNVEKYPPSLQFLAITLGLLCLIVAAHARSANAAFAGPSGLRRVLIEFGREPLFFYVTHLYVIHGLALATALLLAWPLNHVFWRGAGPNLVPPPGYGFGLAGVYVALVIVLMLLRPATSSYCRLKSRSTAPWVKYL